MILFVDFLDKNHYVNTSCSYPCGAIFHCLNRKIDQKMLVFRISTTKTSRNDHLYLYMSLAVWHMWYAPHFNAFQIISKRKIMMVINTWLSIQITNQLWVKSKETLKQQPRIGTRHTSGEERQRWRLTYPCLQSRTRILGIYFNFIQQDSRSTKLILGIYIFRQATFYLMKVHRTSFFLRWCAQGMLHVLVIKYSFALPRRKLSPKMYFVLIEAAFLERAAKFSSCSVILITVAWI